MILSAYHSFPYLLNASCLLEKESFPKLITETACFDLYQWHLSSLTLYQPYKTTDFVSVEDLNSHQIKWEKDWSTCSLRLRTKWDSRSECCWPITRYFPNMNILKCVRPRGMNKFPSTYWIYYERQHVALLENKIHGKHFFFNLPNTSYPMLNGTIKEKERK